MEVLGAIAATCAASVMKVPALAARPPGGETYTATGTFDAKIFLIILRIDGSRPPGVSSETTTSEAPSSSASSIPSTRNSAMMGLTTPSILRWRTRGASALAAAVRAAAARVTVNIPLNFVFISLEI